MAPSAAHTMERSTRAQGQGKAPFKRTSMACTACRQVKLRCDAMNCFPAPCTRCTKQKTKCKFDPKFKRRPVRGSLEKVTKENERLRSQVHEAEMTPSHSPRDASLTAGSADNAASNTQQKASVIEKMTSQLPTPREIEGVCLGEATILALFEHFAAHYLHHLPILDLTKSIDMIWSDSQLLFWTIVVTAASKHPLHSSYFGPLQIPFKHLLSGYLVSSIRCIYTVQALLVLCLWPFPVANQLDDPSWEYIGMAIAANLKLTSDDCQTNWPGSNPLFIDESVRQKTWLGCFAVSTEISAALALPPPMGMVAQIMPKIRHAVQSSLPREFSALLDIQEYTTRAATLLNNPSAIPAQGSLIELLERDLASIEARMPDQGHPKIQLGCLAARLRLYALPVLSQLSLNGQKRKSSSMLKALYMGFHTAIEITNIFGDSSIVSEDMSPISTEQTMDVYFPKHYFKIFIMAGMYFINILAIDSEISAEDKSLARNYIKKVYETLVSWSREPRDEAARGARVIDLLSRHVQASDLSSELQESAHPTPPISIITSGMRMARRLRNKLCSSPSQPTEPSAACVPEQSEFPTGLESNMFEDDILEWNTWLANLDSILANPAAMTGFGAD
ncbi:hypothetical protein POJ06DRAFT_293524 [Lipomyces tetrasporus]|uniref:Zn(2)-C6 fungal-type domain-containing protein n=1 Tax=Lipomyces tetrasporus TaxID=54092 RepID=A0AAD7QYC1_9ASCO|nr:uncharacterized protein POJ06DRAFT_293524 [Lipomyces tetrasporus]KAJ8103699.1 hypothetical protein POJ06DRAFT_293524 [Lipomyces tetrasporus]